MLMGHALQHEVSAVLDAGNVPPAREDRDRVAAAVGHHDLESGDARARGQSHPCHFTTDASRHSACQLTEWGQIQVGEAVEESRVVEILD